MAKIGFTGTMSCGKTTLVKALSEIYQFAHYETATERSKYLMSLGIPLNTDSTLKGQFIFLAERATELMFDNILTDRTIYDVCAFTVLAKSINNSQKYVFEKAAMELKNDYDLIFYVSPEGVNIEDNGVRTTDTNFRSEIDLEIQQLLKRYPPNKLVKIPPYLTTEERIKIVIDNIYNSENK
jgi:nicotinamide riboside kinase